MPDHLTGILEELRDQSTQKGALRKLKGIGCAHLGLAEAAQLVLAAQGSFPPARDEWSADTPTQLLYLARDVAGYASDDEGADLLSAAVEQSFAGFSEQARGAALQVLTNLATPGAARTYAKLVVAHARELGAPQGKRLFHFSTFSTADPRGRRSRVNAEVAAELFPALFPVTREPALTGSIYRTLLGLCEAGLVEPGVLDGHEREFLGMFVRELEGARAHQRVSGPGAHNWKYAEPYWGHRNRLGIALDLAGWWNSPPVLLALEGCGDLSDPWLRLLRVVSLRRLGVWVPKDELSWIADHPRERGWLRQLMDALDRPDDEFPSACMDQRLLAEGDMVEWLCFGTELGREPDEIEHVHVETRDGEDGPLDYYFFRYRVTEDHGTRDNGWMVGMSGGFPRVAGGTMNSDGRTFSKFGKWDEKPLAGHVADYLEA